MNSYGADNMIKEPTIRYLFQQLDIAYNNLWSQQFTSLEKTLQKETHWDGALQYFTHTECIEALQLLPNAHPQYPPNAFQYAGLCDIVKNRKINIPIAPIKRPVAEKSFDSSLSFSEVKKLYMKMDLKTKLEYTPADLHESIKTSYENKKMPMV